VQCGQPDAVAVVPRPSPSPDGPPAALGSGELEGFALSVRSPEAAVCGWAAAVPGPTAEPDLAPELRDLYDQVRSLLSEPPAVVRARLRAIAACLAQAGMPDVSAVMTDPATGSDWLVLSAAGGTLACTVVEISGVSCRVAIAVMTPDADPGPVRRGAPEQRGAAAHRVRPQSVARS
jgi:hypothetical protein